jgi:imidazoleglycerol-phosphate dehydratase/histidinol-phosphatase
MSSRYLFIERIGGLLRRPEITADVTLASLRLQAGCISALKEFRAAGFNLVVLDDPEVVRQTGPAASDKFVTGLFDSEGITFSAIRTCPHAIGANCDCALPGIGLVDEYVADADLDRSRSLVVGDRAATLELARAMGLSGVQLGQTQDWAGVAHTVLNRPRQASVRRTTRETDIQVSVDLDRAAEPAIATGIGFFDHMLEQLGKHGGFALTVQCTGDLNVDEHHTVEDVALAVGEALRKALGDKRGIGRYGFLLPMDEAETRVSIDLSGRAWFVFEGEFPRQNVGGLATEMVSHFFRSLSESLGAAVHLSVRGENAHHMVEACFKGVARTLRQAFARTGSELPSTKGTL